MFYSGMLQEQEFNWYRNSFEYHFYYHKFESYRKCLLIIIITILLENKFKNYTR